MSEKAMGHLEVILSFVMFIGFVMGLFLAFPITKTNQKTVSLDALERAVANYTRADVSYVSFSVKDNLNTDCFFVDITIPDGIPILVKKLNGDSVGAEIGVKTEGGGKKGIFINRGVADLNTFYTIYYSPILTPVPFISPDKQKCQSATGTGSYILGLRRNYTGYFETSIKNLKTEYDDSNKYAALKKSWGIPSSNNFNIIFKKYDEVNKNFVDVYTLNKGQTPSRGVYAREIPIEVLGTSGQVEHWMMRLEEW